MRFEFSASNWTTLKRPSLSTILTGVRRGLLLASALLSVLGAAEGPCPANLSPPGAARSEARASERLEAMGNYQRLERKTTVFRVQTRVRHELVGHQVIEVKTVSSRGLRETRYHYEKYITEILAPYTHVEETRLVVAKNVSPAAAAAWLEKTEQKGIHFPWVSDQYLQRILKILEFTLPDYIARKNWPDSFLRELVVLALQYSGVSTYINVYSRQDGSLAGTVRFINAPYVQIESDVGGKPLALKRTKAWAELQKVRSDASLFNDYVHLPLKKEGNAMVPNRDGLLARLFPALTIHLKDEGILTLPTWQVGRVAFVPTPMELVLKDKLGRYREDAGGELKSLAEPGNFVIARSAPWAMAPLYFHGARVATSLNLAQNVGAVSRNVTYAEEGGGSHRLYEGFGLSPIDRSTEETPTGHPWDVLAGGATSPLEAMRIRMGLNSPEASSALDALIAKLNAEEIKLDRDPLNWTHGGPLGIEFDGSDPFEPEP